jgi:hypothetical protein
MRNDLADSEYDASHENWAGNHPNELENHPQNPNIGVKWDNSSDGTFCPILMVEKVAGATNLLSDVRLAKFTEYRWMLRVGIISPTQFTLSVRIHDAAGRLVLDDSNFGLHGQPLSAYADGWRIWKMGNNGPSWQFAAPNPRTIEAWKFARVRVRTTAVHPDYWV